MNSQKRLFELIKSMLPESDRLANAIAALLDVKPDAAYRRIRGETHLTFPELEKICRTFHLSMDEFLNFKAEQNIMFQYHPISDEGSYTKYAAYLSDRLYETGQASKKELVFSAQDIPFYHFLKYDELSIFRIYVWHHTLKRDVESFSEFCNSSDNREIISIYEKIYHHYTQIPSKEIWTNQTVDTTLRMLEYYNGIGVFDDRKETLHLMVNQLLSLLDTVKQYATDGYKESAHKTPFELYACAVDVENSLMMLRKGDEWSCTLQLYAINQMVTGNGFLCSETLKWMDNLISKSILISGNTAYRERFHFFNALKDKVQDFTNKVIA